MGGIVTHQIKNLVGMALVLFVTTQIKPTISCGQGGAFLIQNNATLNLSGADLTDATIRVAIGGTLEGVVEGSNTTLVTQSEDGDKVITFNGDLSMAASELNLNACTMVLTEDTVLDGADWYFHDDATLDGGGNVFDIDNGTVWVAEGKVLKLRNIILKNVHSNSFSNGNGTINFNKVTMMINEDVSWVASPTHFVVEGPTLVVTGQYSLTVDPESAVINDATLSYDTLSSLDAHNVVGFGGNGRLLFVGGIASFVETIVSDENPYLLDNMYLYETNGSVDGHIVRFDYEESTGYTYNGSARTIFFPRTTGEVFFIENDVDLALENITLDGLLPEHIAYGNANASLHFNDQTTIKLQQDWLLDQELHFGSGGVDSMTLDLNNHSISFVGDGGLVLYGGADAILHIKNGTLLELSDSVIQAASIGRIIFENVELVLNSDFTWLRGNLMMRGNCVMGTFDSAQFINTSSAEFAIPKGATLRLSPGITYLHANEGDDNFTLIGQVELVNATFKRADDVITDASLIISGGTIRVDHNSTIDVGTKGITLGANIGVDLYPGATLSVVGSGVLRYLNETTG